MTKLKTIAVATSSSYNGVASWRPFKGVVLDNDNDGAGPALYQQFLNACIHRDLTMARECVDPDAFFAMVPGQGRLDFKEFFALFGVLREVAPDFGDSITVQNVVQQGNQLVMKYHMRYTMAVGNQRIEFTGMDLAVFVNGRISELHIFYDRASTREQVGMPPTDH